MNQKTQIIFFDTETGGLDPTVNPILTLGACSLDLQTGKIIETYQTRIKHKDYSGVTDRALEINGIDLEEHHNHPKAEWPHIAQQSFKDWLDGIRQPQELLIRGGHNVDFDDGFLVCGLIDKRGVGFPMFEYFHYKKVDTQMIAITLKEAGLISIESTSLKSITRYFNIPINNYHTALDDSVGTANVYFSMLQLLRGFRRAVQKYKQECITNGISISYKMDIFGTEFSF